MGATMDDHDKRCMMWCMQRTNIYLEERQTELLDQLAIDQGVSRAEVVAPRTALCPASDAVSAVFA